MTEQMNLQRERDEMKKIKPSREQRVDACSKKVREFFYNVVMKIERSDVANEFNSEWCDIAYDFGLHKRLTLGEYEKEVDKLLKKWTNRLTH